MKNVIKSLRFIIFLVTVFTFSISCSDDTIDELSDDSQSFLEQNDGTEWQLVNDDITVYIRINNDVIQLIEQWSYNNELKCYIYNPNIFSPGNYEIKENSINKLVIDCDNFLADCDYMTFLKQANTLKCVIRISEWEEETVYFNESSAKVDELLKCDVENESERLKFYN